MSSVRCKATAWLLSGTRAESANGTVLLWRTYLWPWHRLAFWPVASDFQCTARLLLPGHARLHL